MPAATSLLPLQTSDRHTITVRLTRGLVTLNLLALAGIAVWFRCCQLGTIPGINGDEAWYGIEAMRWLQGEPIQWRTPTNNPLNLLYFAPLVLLHTLSDPSPAVLRGAALLSGLAALPIAFWLGYRALGWRHATIAAAIAAVLPLNIAYSRFGWDASQTLPITLPIVYLPLVAMTDEGRRQRWLIASVICLLAAMWVHPTNIFAAPLVALPALWMWRDELQTTWRNQSPNSRVALAMMAISAVLATAIMARHWLGPVLERLTDPAQFGQFLIHYHRLLNGTTAYRYIAGSGWADDSWTSLPQWDLMLSDVATWTVSALVLFTLWQQARRNWSSREACLLASWGAMLMGFYLVAGVGAIQPHYERYAICLIAPAIAMAARAIEIRCQGAEGQRFCLPVGLALAWLLLLGFGTHYFGFFYRTGGRSHDTFRCGVVEPKSAALNHIVCQSTGADPVWIVTSQYWNDRPLAYLASAHRHLRVGPLERFEHSAERTTALATSRVWHVEFAGSAEYRDTLAMLDKRGMSYEETAIADFAGRPVLMLVRPKGKRATAADQIAALPTTSEVDGPRE